MGIIQICSEITRGAVLNGKLYSQRLQKLIHLSTDYFMKISCQFMGPVPIDWKEIFKK